MKKIVNLLQVLDNLSRIPRTGGSYGGVPPQLVESISIHSYKVSCISLLLGEVSIKNGKHIDMGLLLKTALSHDWHEVILLDIPTHSPSFMSYFDGEEFKNHVKTAEKNAVKAIEQYVNDLCDLRLDAEKTSDEYQLVLIADTMALMLEILQWKQHGLRYEWFDYLWSNTKLLLEKRVRQFPFISPIIEELQVSYDSGVKPANSFLTKKEFQSFTKK